MLALDRDLLTEKVTQFGELPSYTLVPPGIRDYVSPVPEWSEWTQAEREKEARRLYAMAGYSEENPLEFEIRYSAGANNKKMALAASSLWKQVLGVQATLLNEENKVFLQNREQKILTQVFQAGWISDYADPYSFLNLFRSGHGRNDYGYSNKLYDTLLDEVSAERIPSIRRRLMFETERLLLADIPFIPLYTYVTKRMVNPRLKGWQSNVMDHHYSKHMFFLKAAPDEPSTAVEVIEISEIEGQSSIASEPLQEIAVAGEEDGVILKEEDAESALPQDGNEATAPGQEQGLDQPLEEKQTGVVNEEVLTDTVKDDETTPEDSLE